MSGSICIAVVSVPVRFFCLQIRADAQRAAPLRQRHRCRSSRPRRQRCLAAPGRTQPLLPAAPPSHNPTHLLLLPPRLRRQRRPSRPWRSIGEGGRGGRGARRRRGVDVVVVAEAAAAAAAAAAGGGGGDGDVADGAAAVAAAAAAADDIEGGLGGAERRRIRAPVETVVGRARRLAAGRGLCKGEARVGIDMSNPLLPLPRPRLHWRPSRVLLPRSVAIAAAAVAAASAGRGACHRRKRQS